MVKRVDQRPTRPDDSLKRLIARVDNPQTVPHGVKVAKPDERVVFYDSSYVARTWDGDAIADFDTRISEAKTALSNAEESLSITEGNLADARERIAQVEANTDPAAIGDTAAAQINKRQLINGRNAVIPGTLDVAQLNVTEQMSAQIVSAMSMESKKLVVTDETVLNKATVVQSLVTPELVAQKINSALMTGSVIQTNSAANTGVKIDSTGYKAYDSAGNLSVKLDGKDNFFTGELQTSNAEGRGVKISQDDQSSRIDFYPSTYGAGSSLNTHGYIETRIPSNLSERGLYIGATDAKTMSSDDPGIILQPSAKSVGFQGRFAASSPALKSGKANGASMDVGTWMTWNITFPEPFINSAVSIFVMPANANNVPVSWSVGKVTLSGFELRIRNNGHAATGTQYNKWMAFGIVAV